MSNELGKYELLEELRRIGRGRRIGSRKIRVTAAGMTFTHGLGKVPDEVIVMPLSELTWWFTRPPDAQRIYLQSSADGDVLITVSKGE